MFEKRYVINHICLLYFTLFRTRVNIQGAKIANLHSCGKEHALGLFFICYNHCKTQDLLKYIYLVFI